LYVYLFETITSTMNAPFLRTYLLAQQAQKSLTFQGRQFKHNGKALVGLTKCMDDAFGDTWKTHRKFLSPGVSSATRGRMLDDERMALVDKTEELTSFSPAMDVYYTDVITMNMTPVTTQLIGVHEEIGTAGDEVSILHKDKDNYVYIELKSGYVGNIDIVPPKVSRTLHKTVAVPNSIRARHQLQTLATAAMLEQTYNIKFAQKWVVYVDRPVAHACFLHPLRSRRTILEWVPADCEGWVKNFDGPKLLQFLMKRKEIKNKQNAAKKTKAKGEPVMKMKRKTNKAIGVK
jgi:hypothetical protein